MGKFGSQTVVHGLILFFSLNSVSCLLAEIILGVLFESISGHAGRWTSKLNALSHVEGTH